MLIPFGVLSAAGAEVAGDYELIATEILGSAQSSITFSNLGDYASTYKHLQFRIAARSDRPAIGDSAMLRFNGDSAGNYRAHWLNGDGTSVAAQETGAGATKLYGARMAGGSAAANIFGGGVCDILDVYSASKNTTTRALTGSVASSPILFLFSGVWLNVSTISSVTLFADMGTNFVAGSRFSLYGIRG
jgi:hypothetical protein